MRIETVVVGPIETNCYLVEDEGELLVIDPGAEPSRILDAIGGRTVRCIVLTHAHWDHIDALCAVADETGAPIAAGVADAGDIENPSATALFRLHGYGHPIVDQRLGDGDEVFVGSCVFRAIETPGHTPGSICLYCPEEGVLFSGDTVFSGGRFGRTDFENGSMEDMKDSLAKIAGLVADGTQIYCGHERSTTMERERKLNPYFK